MRDFKEVYIEYLEQEIANQSPNEKDRPYVISGGESYSLEQILENVRAETTEGLKWLEMGQQLAIDIFLRTGGGELSPEETRLAKQLLNMCRDLVSEDGDWSLSDLNNTMVDIGEELQRIDEQQKLFEKLNAKTN
jgi:hypothetical protein